MLIITCLLDDHMELYYPLHHGDDGISAGKSKKLGNPHDSCDSVFDDSSYVMGNQWLQWIRFFPGTSSQETMGLLYVGKP